MAFRYLAIPLALVIAGCAAPPNIEIVEGFAQAPPPPRYDVPYHGHLTVIRVPSNETAQTCIETSKAHGGRMASTNALGCAIARDNYCIIVVPANDTAIIVRGEVYPITAAEIHRHEIGHCNGWSHAR